MSNIRILYGKTVRNWTKSFSREELTFITVLTSGHFVVHWYTNILSLALPFIKEDLSLNDVQVGFIVTIQMGVPSVFIMIFGFVADSFRKKGAIIVSSAMVSFGAALFLIGFAQSYLWVILGTGLIGIGTALWHPAAMGALSIKFSDRRGMVLSVHGVGASIGDAIGPIVVGAIFMLVDWKLTLGLHLFPALVIGFFLWRGLGAMNTVSSEKSTITSYLASLSSMFSDRQAIALMMSNTLIGMSRLSVLAFFPIYFKETLNYSSFGLGVYLALLYVTGIISQPIMGVLSDRIGRKWILLPSFFSMSVLYICIILVPKGIILGIVVGLLGMFFYAILNMNQTAIMDVAPRQVQSSTMGVMGLVGLPFTLISPVAAGYLVTEFGIESAFWFAGFTAMLAAITLAPIKFRRIS